MGRMNQISWCSASYSVNLETAYQINQKQDCKKYLLII